MFSKILIANRGEIAVRIIRTCHDLGIQTVAIYSDTEQNALHVRMADEAFALGGTTTAESYLNMERVLEIIQTSGADAVHPGYGFYAENAAFAQAVADCGATWIGPPPEAITTMGDKISARQTARAANVPTVPGTENAIGSPDEIVAFGKKYGWPVAIKAAHGGGGHGIRVVTNESEVVEALTAAQREAVAYFGRSEAYIERFFSEPRHVEIQILADKHGNCITLGERDCSIQRRHQKLIEESPAPLLSDQTRSDMASAAVRISKACGYVGVGTMEMLYNDDAFYFLEMNTRLQVEHGVTEAVTGLDLVEQQIRVAAGEPLNVGEIEIRGHAIECRVNAENPATNFTPSPGTLADFEVPSGPDIRWDGGYESGDVISPHFDNLIGKLVVWGPDRDSARRRTLRALTEFRISGVATTLPVQKAILESEAFITSGYNTNWLEGALDSLNVSNATNAASEESASVRDGLSLYEVPIETNGKRFTVKAWMPTGTGEQRGQRRAPRKTAATSAAHQTNPGAVTSPMQGNVIQVLVAEGDQVAMGDQVLILEAMKMENRLTAGSAGIVKEVRVKTGDNVGPGDTLIIIE